VHHSTWIEAEGDPERFWTITPREAVRELKSLATLQRRKHEQHRWLAWHIGALGRVNDYPDFDEFVQPSGPRVQKKRSWEEMHADALAWAMRGKPQ